MKKRLQVFISSTYTDLIDERQAAVAAVLKSGHIPAGMELFKSGDKSQMAIIKKWIEESDVYMLILGGRYGSIDEESGQSYTELEYNYAIELEKPIFSAVIKEDSIELKVKKYGTKVIEQENPDKLKSFRKKVLTFMSSFFDDLKDIKLCVLESLPEIAETRNLSGWVSGNEIQDSSALAKEIKKLQDENIDLRKKYDELKKSVKTTQKEPSKREMDALRDLLEKIVIDIPKEVTEKGVNSKRTLLDLLYALQSDMVKGITNRPGASKWESHIFNKICPKLQIHGLVQLEKITSTHYRRFSITKKGQEFVAYLDSKILVRK